MYAEHEAKLTVTENYIIMTSFVLRIRSSVVAQFVF